MIYNTLATQIDSFLGWWMWMSLNCLNFSYDILVRYFRLINANVPSVIIPRTDALPISIKAIFVILKPNLYTVLFNLF